MAPRGLGPRGWLACLSSVTGFPGTGHSAVNAIVALGVVVCPDRHLIKAFNKDEYKHQTVPLLFQVPSFSSSPAVPQTPTLFLSFSEPLCPALCVTLMTLRDTGTAALHQARSGEVSSLVSPLAGTCWWDVPVTASQPHSSASLVLQPRTQVGVQPGHTLGPRGRLARWLGLDSEAGCRAWRNDVPRAGGHIPWQSVWSLGSGQSHRFVSQQECKQSGTPHVPGHRP